MFGIYYSADVSQNGTVLSGLECPAYVGSSSYRPQLPNPITGFSSQPDGSQEAYFTTGSIAASGPAFRVRAVKDPGSNVIAVLAQPLVDQDSTLHTLFLTELAVTAAALVLALVGGWWLVRLGLKPLEDVEATADSIAAGNLDRRVPGAEQSTEVGRLARALNIMLERIQSAFSARLASEARLKESEQHLRQFVADASHELRTPIAAVSAYAELFERGGAEHVDDLPRIVSGIRTETARMDRLVNDLLTLARLDEGIPMEQAPVELVALDLGGGADRDRGGSRVARPVLGVPPRRGDRGHGPPAPGHRQPPGERAGPHATGHHDHGARGRGRGPGADRGA